MRWPRATPWHILGNSCRDWHHTVQFVVPFLGKSRPWTWACTCEYVHVSTSALPARYSFRGHSSTRALAESVHFLEPEVLKRNEVLTCWDCQRLSYTNKAWNTMLQHLNVFTSLEWKLKFRSNWDLLINAGYTTSSLLDNFGDPDLTHQVESQMYHTNDRCWLTPLPLVIARIPRPCSNHTWQWKASSPAACEGPQSLLIEGVCFWKSRSRQMAFNDSCHYLLYMCKFKYVYI